MILLADLAAAECRAVRNMSQCDITSGNDETYPHAKIGYPARRADARVELCGPRGEGRTQMS